MQKSGRKNLGGLLSNKETTCVLGSYTVYMKKVAWIATFVVVAVTLALFVQQSVRRSYDHPQIEIVADTVARLQQGAAILDQIPAGDVNIESSSKEFVVIFDTEGGPIAGNGYIEEKLLTPPIGVFDAAKQKGEYRVTLEPKKGTRIAAVIKPFVGREANGYVLSGRRL
jgi:hypothetical protein